MSAESTNLKPIPLGIAATLAIIHEVTAPKPGNVHRGADFEDVIYLDFVESAVVVGPIVARVDELGVGATVLECVRATKAAVRTNTNLGTLLLMVPLAAVVDGLRHAAGIERVLQELSFDDTCHVFEAIRTAAAGGLGNTEEADIHDKPPAGLSLIEAMRMASERDLIARQYVNNFEDVRRIASWIEEGVDRGWPLGTAIVHAHVRQMAGEADSLIVRKCGPEVGEKARLMAARVLSSGLPGDETYESLLSDFDFWLRSDGHRRNPGTTADLIAAALFVLLREGRLESRR